MKKGRIISPSSSITFPIDVQLQMRLTLVWKFILFSSVTRKTIFLIRLQMKKVFSTVRMGHSIKTLHSREGHSIVPKWHNARRKVRGLLKCHVTAFVHFWTKFHHKDLGKSIILLKEKSQVTWGMEYKTISPNVTWWREVVSNQPKMSHIIWMVPY